MNLTDYFKRKKTPQNSGNSMPISHETLAVKYYLELPDIEGRPLYEITENLTVGSEVGSVQIEHDSISPRHCTFSFNSGVVSVLDHSSDFGTYIGQKRIPPGRMIILQDDDPIQIGELSAHIIHSEESVDIQTPQFDALPETPSEDEQSEENSAIHASMDDPTTGGLEVGTDLIQEATSDYQIDEVFEDDATQNKGHSNTVSFHLTQLGKRIKDLTRIGKAAAKHEMTSKTTLQEAPAVAGALPRIFALMLDVLISLILATLFSETFLQQMIFSAIDTVKSLVMPLYEMAMQTIITQYPLASKMNQSILDFFTNDAQTFLLVVGLYVGLRLISSLLLSVTLGQKLLLMSPSDTNPLIGRLKAVARELLAPLFAPFLLFDLPCLFSKRTFKEFITASELRMEKLGPSYILALFLIPLFVLILAISPLFSGLEYRASIPITNIISEEVINLEGQINMSSLGMHLALKEGVEHQLQFNLEMKDGKKQLSPSLQILFDKNKVAKLRYLRSINTKKLLKRFFNATLMGKEEYSELEHFALTPENKSLSYRVNEKRYHSQLQKLLRTSFNLAPNTLMDYVTSHGPLVKGAVDFRSEIQQIVGSSFNKIEFANFANQDGVLFTLNSTIPKFVFLKLDDISAAAYLLELPEKSRFDSFLNWGASHLDLSSNDSKVHISAYRPLYDADVLLLADIHWDKISSEEYRKKMVHYFAESLLSALDKANDLDSSQSLASYILAIENNFIKSNEESRLAWNDTYQKLLAMQKAYAEQDRAFLNQMLTTETTDEASSQKEEGQQELLKEIY